MKNFYFTSIFLFILTASQGQISEELLFNEGPIIIEGKISNHKSNQIMFTAKELVGSIKHLAKIDKNGNFRFAIDVLSAHENYISYGGDLVTVFLKPNDSLYLKADGKNFKESIIYTGGTARTNRALNLFFLEFESIMNTWKYLEAKRDMKPKEFMLLASEFFERSRIKADSIYNVVQPGPDAKFWLKNYIKYREIEELLEYGMANSETLPDDYYDFEKKLSSVEASAMQCSAYYEDIIMKYHFGFKMQKIEGFENALKKFNQQTYEGLETLFSFIKENMSVDPKIKDLFLTKLLVHHLESGNMTTVEEFLPVFSKNVNDITSQNYVFKLIDKKKLQPALTVKTLDDLVGLPHSGEIFKELQRKSKGEALYFNIWAPWCGSSRNSMPAFRKIQSELKGRNIAFVHLGVMTSQQNWEETRGDFGSGGQHFLLNKLQYQELADILRFYGVPRFLIIDRTGNIVDTQAKTPHSPALKEELLTLSKI